MINQITTRAGEKKKDHKETYDQSLITWANDNNVPKTINMAEYVNVDNQVVACKTSTDADIVASIQNIDIESDDDEEPEPTSKKLQITASIALSSLQKVFEFYETN